MIWFLFDNALFNRYIYTLLYDDEEQPEVKLLFIKVKLRAERYTNRMKFVAMRTCMIAGACVFLRPSFWRRRRSHEAYVGYAHARYTSLSLSLYFSFLLFCFFAKSTATSTSRFETALRAKVIVDLAPVPPWMLTTTRFSIRSRHTRRLGFDSRTSS